MTVYCGSLRETGVEAMVESLGVAGRITCLECLGSGVWAFMAPETPSEPCDQ